MQFSILHAMTGCNMKIPCGGRTPRVAGMETTETQVERVTLELRQLIFDGELPPGQHIAEIPIAERLGSSRTPVRLALGILENEGLVTRAPRRGFVVRQITIAEIADAFDVRGVLEGLACETLIDRGFDTATRVILEECIEEGERLLASGRFTAADAAHWSRMNARFHLAVATGAGSKPLEAAIRFNSRVPLVPAGAIAFKVDNLGLAHRYMSEAQNEHVALVSALRRRDAAAAVALARTHARNSRDNLKAELERTQARLLAPAIPGLRLVIG